MASTVGIGYQTTKRVATNALMEVRVLGFKPKKVTVTNLSNSVQAEWNESLGDGYALKRIADGTLSVVTSAGITPLAGTSTLPPGFSLGALADVNDTTTENLLIEAWG